MCPHIGLCAPFLQVKEVGAGEDEENIVSILPQKTAAYVFKLLISALTDNGLKRI